MDSFPRPLGWTVVGMLCLALLPLPYGYYMLLRLVACVGFAWVAFSHFRSGAMGWATATGVLALLYNPLLPVYLTRELWILINIGSAAAMVGAIVALDKARQAQRD